VLMVLNITIPVGTTAVYLGIKFERRHGWNAHFNDVTNKVAQRLNGLKLVSRRSLGFSTKTAITIYKVMIRTAIEFGSIAWASASATSLERLQKLQNRALRIALRLPRWTPIPRLHELADVEMLDTFVRRRCAEYGNGALLTNKLVGNQIREDGDRQMTAYWQSKAPLAAFKDLLAPQLLLLATDD
jgi:hypothetical protein